MTDAVLEAPSAPSAASAPSTLSKSYRAYALGLLVAIYTVNFLDRQVVTLLLESIKKDLKLDDFQMGTMGGLWFALFYTFLGIPIARAADKGDRPLIITLSLAVWSGFTLLAGAAWNFVVLAISRMGVGVGEAGCTPTAHSLITEYFPKESRARAVAIYSMGISIGSLLGMGLGGIIAGSYGWRVAFFVAGAPGLLLAVLSLISLAEPRRAAKFKTSAASPYLPIGQVMKVLSGKPTFWLFALGGAFTSMVSYSHAAFLTSFYLRVYPAETQAAAESFHMTSLGFLGLAMGLAAGIGGVSGSWMGGWWSDKFGSRDGRQIPMLPILSPFICLPTFWFLLTQSNITLAMILLIIPNVGVAIWYGPVYGGVPGLVPPAMRATTSAILLFIVNLIGLGAGPTLFGLLSDTLTNNALKGTDLDVQACKTALDAAAKTCSAAAASGIRGAVYWSTTINGLALICFFLSRYTIRKDLES